MQYQKLINIPVILTSLMFLACTAPNEAKTTPSKIIQNSEIVSPLCFASVEGNSKINTLIEQKIQHIREAPNNLQRWVELGNRWIKKSKLSNDPGFYLHAQECAEYVLKQDNTYIPAKELLTQVLLNNHEFSTAKNLAQTIVTAAPESPLGWALLSDAQLELGDIEQVQLSIEKLEDLNAGMAFFTRLSYLNWLQGDIKGANDALLASLQRRDMKNAYPAAWSFAQAAEISWHRNDLAGTEALYKESLKWLPDFPLALTGLARVSMALNNPQAAIKLIQRIATTEQNANAIWLLADANEMAGDKESSINNQNRFIKLARLNDPFLLTRFLSTKNRDQILALELILNEKKTRGGIYIEDAYAWSLYRLGRFEEAQVAIEKALDWGTKDATLFYHAGAIKIATGHIQEGVTLVRKALTLQPSFDFSGSKEAAELIKKYGEPANV